MAYKKGGKIPPFPEEGEKEKEKAPCDDRNSFRKKKGHWGGGSTVVPSREGRRRGEGRRFLLLVRRGERKATILHPKSRVCHEAAFSCARKRGKISGLRKKKVPVGSRGRGGL